MPEVNLEDVSTRQTTVINAEEADPVPATVLDTVSKVEAEIQRAVPGDNTGAMATAMKAASQRKSKAKAKSTVQAAQATKDAVEVEVSVKPAENSATTDSETKEIPEMDISIPFSEKEMEDIRANVAAEHKARAEAASAKKEAAISRKEIEEEMKKTLKMEKSIKSVIGGLVIAVLGVTLANKSVDLYRKF